MRAGFFSEPDTILDKIQALIKLCDESGVRKTQILVAAAPILEAAERGEEIADAAWLLVPQKMRSPLFCMALLEAAK